MLLYMFLIATAIAFCGYVLYFHAELTEFFSYYKPFRRLGRILFKLLWNSSLIGLIFVGLNVLTQFVIAFYMSYQ